MNDLEQYVSENTENEIGKWKHYFEIYDKHFSRFRGTEVYLVEFGVNQGGSLKMWRHYFGPKAKIFGIDINPHCKDLEEAQINIIVGDQEDTDFLKSLCETIPRIDILIDDGGHTMKQQINTFEEMFASISENGVYLCEDLHTSYRPHWGGGYKKRGTFIEYSKNFIDYINAWHADWKSSLSLWSVFRGSLKVTDFTRSVHSLHYYDSVLVIEKRPSVKPGPIHSGRAVIPGYSPPSSRLKRIRDRVKLFLGTLLT